MNKFDRNLKEAIALKYDEMNEDAPQVVAKGEGLIAEQILQKAAENDVPIYEDPTLIELMGHLNINDKIPEDLYQAVAEVFVFIYRMDHKMK